MRRRQKEARPEVDWMRAEGKPSPGPLIMWLSLCSGYRGWVWELRVGAEAAALPRGQGASCNHKLARFGCRPEQMRLGSSTVTRGASGGGRTRGKI